MSITAEIGEINPDSVSKDLVLEITSKYGGRTNYIDQYIVIDNQVILPFAYATSVLDLPRPQRSGFTEMVVPTIVPPRPEQVPVLKEAIRSLNSTGSIVISAHVGFGKTPCGIFLACRTRHKTLIITKGLPLVKQWGEDILKFCPTARVQVLKPKTEFDPDCDFFVINAQNVVKFPSETWYDIGTVIVDEAHLIMAEVLARSLRYIYPRYMIALTATPYRPDGLNRLLDLYFGETKIIRKLNHPHTAYKVSTGFVPEIEFTDNGGKKRLKWDSVLKSQAESEARNDLIRRIITHFSDRKFLVFVKRVSHGEYLYDILRYAGESVTRFLDTDEDFDRSARILIGTTSKIGPGFNHPDLDALLMATDIEGYFIQYMGRVFRRKDVHPLIFDLVDKNGLLIKHYKTREQVYLEHGGTVQTLDVSGM